MSRTELEVLVRIAAEAAVLVAEVYAKPFEVEYKGPRDPVTIADRRANELIVERLTREFPGTPIVAEESGFFGFRAAPDADHYVRIHAAGGYSARCDGGGLQRLFKAGVRVPRSPSSD